LSCASAATNSVAIASAFSFDALDALLMSETAVWMSDKPAAITGAGLAMTACPSSSATLT
jgi:hypothetical protein